MNSMKKESFYILFIVLFFYCSGNKVSFYYNRAKFKLDDTETIEGYNPRFFIDSLNTEYLRLKILNDDKTNKLIKDIELKNMKTLQLSQKHRGKLGMFIGGLLVSIYAKEIAKQEFLLDNSYPLFLFRNCTVLGGIVGYYIGSKFFVWEDYDLSRYQSFIPPIDNGGFKIGFSVPIKRWWVFNFSEIEESKYENNHSYLHRTYFITCKL